MSDPSTSTAGGRRKPPLPKPSTNNNGAATSTTTPGGLQVTAKAFVPGGGGGSGSNGSSPSSATNNTASSSSNSAMLKALSAQAPSFQPKFSKNATPGSISNNNEAEPSPDSIATATKSISKDHAQTVASKSKMRATAEGFTPTRSETNSFPSSPEKNTPATVNNNTKGAPPQLPSSPPSGVKKPVQQAITTAPSSSNTNNNDTNTGSNPTSPNSKNKPMEYPDPFKNSKLEISEEGKKQFAQHNYAAPAPQKDPMGLNTAWTMYALDQSSRFAGAFGAVSESQQQQLVAAASNSGPTKLYQVADVEGFWRLLRSIPLPASRSPKFTYYFFRKTIFPSWEEPRNKNGGTFQFMVWDSARGSTDKELANDVWHMMLMGLIGETFAEASVINGVCFKVRKAMTIELWTNNCSQKQIAAFMNSVKATISKRFGTSFPLSQLEGLDFTSNETNHNKSMPPPPPPPPSGSPNSAHPGKGNKNNNNHHPQSPVHPKGGNNNNNSQNHDFKL